MLFQTEGEAITEIGLMFGSIFILVFLTVLMWYFFTTYKSNQTKFVVIVVIFLFSIIIGVSSIASVSIPFSPWFQLFFLLIQTIFFILSVIDGF